MVIGTFRSRSSRYHAQDDDPPSDRRGREPEGSWLRARNLEESRDCILDAGVELLAEADYSFDPANLGLIDACRRAGSGPPGAAQDLVITAEFRGTAAAAARHRREHNVPHRSLMAAPRTPG